MDTVFCNVTAVTMDEAMHILPGAFVGVRGGRIAYIGRKMPAEPVKEAIDGTGMVLMPGLINCHTHLAMTGLRGWSDDKPLQPWLEDCGKIEDKLDDRAVRCMTQLGLMELLRFGTTSFSDMYDHVDAIAQAVAECGIKANLARGTTMFLGDGFDWRTFPACVELRECVEKWHEYDDGRIRIEASVHGEYTSTYQLWEALADYAADENLGMHVHLSETRDEHEASLDRNGLTPAQVLDCHRVWDTRAMAAHCVWLDEEDMGLLARRHVSAVHCPVSNLKLGSGIAPVVKLRAEGMNVALGTDSAASNNNLDLFEEIKTAALLAKVQSGDPSALPAAEVLKMATRGGALAQSRDDECGQIAIGMDADLILLDFTQPHLIPCHNVVSQLVYAASGHDVALTMVRGRILYRDGTFLTIDELAVLRELKDYVIPNFFEAKDEDKAGDKA